MTRHLVLLAAALFAAFAPNSYADEAIPRGQLPDDVRPERYRLQLTVDPRLEQFSGIAEIDVNVTRPVRSIWLHGHGLTVRKVTVKAAHTELTGNTKKSSP